MPPSLTVAITAFRETTRRGGKQIKDAIASAASSPLVSEVVVVDDASEDFNQLANLIEGMPKTILFCNPENRGVLANKAESVFRSTGEWVQLCDSDNLMRTDFFDAISKRATWDKTQWICPSFAAPEFNYQHLSGVYCLESMPSFLQRPLAECCLNTGNQCVHRESFLELFGRYRTVDSHLKQPDSSGGRCMTLPIVTSSIRHGS
jgi:glycosyltransferase involved in cell wall biosynthesis